MVPRGRNILKNKLANIVASRKAGPVVMLVALGLLMVSIFAPLAGATSETAPGTGLPASAESMRAQKFIDAFPNKSEGTLAFAVYSTFDKREMTQEQFDWITGKQIIVPQQPTANLADASGRFNKWLETENPVLPYSTDFGNTTVNFVLPLRSYTEPEKCVPFGETEEIECSTVELTNSRIDYLREIAKSDLPAGLQVQISGPEAVRADVSKIFEGANFLLLMVTFLIVMLLLVVTYRSPILWIIPITVVGCVEFFAKDLATAVAKLVGIETVDASVGGILSVLVLGVGTDYAFLLISRYREELLLIEDRRKAMASAWKGAAPAILASGVTVVLALLTLMLAENTATRTLGIVCATGVFAAMVAALFVLPAALVLFGRWIFWPLKPKVGAVSKVENGIWARLGRGVSKRPIIVASAGALVLFVLATASTGVKVGLASNEQFQTKPESIIGIEQLVKADFSVATVKVIANDFAYEDSKYRAEYKVPGVHSVDVVASHNGKTMLDVHLYGVPGSQQVNDTIQRLRAQLRQGNGAEAIVGGQDAQTFDLAKATERDRNKIIPIILGIVFLVLLVLLRSLVAPVLLLLTVVASFFASLGAGWLVFTGLLGYPALDLSVYLYSFLFLVALGIDYNIFLATRAREESEKLGVKEGMIRALATTGGVITSAGVLLAAVFAVLGVLPLIALFQVGVIVCIGVLLDTLLVRTVIVPALAFIAGDKFWWPRKQSK
jgi:RND superfamily putative drug exporter